MKIRSKKSFAAPLGAVVLVSLGLSACVSGGNRSQQVAMTCVQLNGMAIPAASIGLPTTGGVVTSAQIATTGTLATTFVFGDFDQLRAVIDPTATNVTRLEYDQLGRRTLLDDPDTGASTSHYTGPPATTSRRSARTSPRRAD